MGRDHRFECRLLDQLAPVVAELRDLMTEDRHKEKKLIEQLGGILVTHEELLNRTRRLEERAAKEAAFAAGDQTLYCSFCGKSQHEVKKMIAGPASFICDECIVLCMDIIGEESDASALDD